MIGSIEKEKVHYIYNIKLKRTLADANTYAIHIINTSYVANNMLYMTFNNYIGNPAGGINVNDTVHII